MIPSGNENRGGAVTSHDVARLAGVSQATVSRVLRQDPKVRPETRDRVLRVLAETRYEPNAAVRAFRTRHSGRLASWWRACLTSCNPAMLESIGARLASW